MVKQHEKDFFHLFGFIVWGDFDGVTMYRNRKGKMVAFAKTWPEHLPRPAIIAQKAKFKAASQDWVALSAEAKRNWEAVTKRLSLTMTGYNLFMHYKLQPDLAALATLEHQSGISLLP